LHGARPLTGQNRTALYRRCQSRSQDRTTDIIEMIINFRGRG
jgi:hypothetical protein